MYQRPTDSANPTTNTSTANTPYRTGTPEDDGIATAPGTNPFATPYASFPGSRRGSTSALQFNETRYFHSRRVKKGTVERTWLNKKDPKEKWVTIIPIIGIILGLGITGVLIWDGLRSVVNHVYCPVLDENWSNGFNTKVWTKEAEVGGFG
jgi:hypothetical protein